MKDKRIVDSWNRIEPDADADERMLRAILARKRKLYEKQERQDAFLLCLTQIAMFVMTLSIVAVVFIISPVIAGVLIISYTAICVFVSIPVILLHLKNNNNMKEQIL